MKYIGGPLDGKELKSLYDHLPVILWPWPLDDIQGPESIEHYELRGGVRVHVASEPFQAGGDPSETP